MSRRSRKPASECRPEEAAFLQSIVDNPHDEGLWLILADWLEENDDPRRAELLRLHRRLIATCCEPEKAPERAEQQARIVQLLAEGVRPSVPRQTLSLAYGVEMTFAWIPPGTFLMGSPEGEEERKKDEVQHRVTLTQGFWLAATPVTHAQWKALTSSNPAERHTKMRPVEAVSWEDCQKYSRRAGELVRKTYRLPTEAEWEYACRAGTTTPFFVGQMLSRDEMLSPGPRPVGVFPPNAWGLYDMHGNMGEWCQDCYGPYGKGPAIDPVAEAGSRGRVHRGRSWCYPPRLCRAAARYAGSKSIRYDYVGFRPALSSD